MFWSNVKTLSYCTSLDFLKPKTILQLKQVKVCHVAHVSLPCSEEHFYGAIQGMVFVSHEHEAKTTFPAKAAQCSSAGRAAVESAHVAGGPPRCHPPPHLPWQNQIITNPPVHSLLSHYREICDSERQTSSFVHSFV